ncbi:MAG: alpha/beta hydrolase family protein [Acidimicrobiales bacterium]
MSGRWSEIAGPAGTLRFYAAGGPRDGSAPLLVLCPELPTIEGARGDVAHPYESVADRVALESGWRVIAAMFRGLDGSKGSFSAKGWLEDAGALIDAEIGARARLRAAGFGFGGAVALALAANDQRVGGVACFATPSGLAQWVSDPVALAERCRSAGVIEEGFPIDAKRWASELPALEPVASVARLGDRPLLVVQGSRDGAVPPETAGALAGAAGESGELRMVLGAGHWLRADPRATATLIGWLERQR